MYSMYKLSTYFQTRSEGTETTAFDQYLNFDHILIVTAVSIKLGILVFCNQ